jgi:hypothetical protein
VEMGAREEGKMIVCYVSRVDPMRVIILDLEFSLLIIFRVRKKSGNRNEHEKNIFLDKVLFSTHAFFSVEGERDELHWPFMLCNSP